MRALNHGVATKLREIAQIIDDEISDLLKDIEQNITALLEQHRPELESLANALLDKETLEADEILAICG
jgi:cell division protease FtsH